VRGHRPLFPRTNATVSAYINLACLANATRFIMPRTWQRTVKQSSFCRMTVDDVQHISAHKQSVRPLETGRTDCLNTGRTNSDLHSCQARIASPLGPIQVAETTQQQRYYQRYMKQAPFTTTDSTEHNYAYSCQNMFTARLLNNNEHKRPTKEFTY